MCPRMTPQALSSLALLLVEIDPKIFPLFLQNSPNLIAERQTHSCLLGPYLLFSKGSLETIKSAGSPFRLHQEVPKYPERAARRGTQALDPVAVLWGAPKHSPYLPAASCCPRSRHSLGCSRSQTSGCNVTRIHGRRWQPKVQTGAVRAAPH